MNLFDMVKSEMKWKMENGKWKLKYNGNRERN